MAANRPITDEDRATVARMHGEGKLRNEIARELGRSGSTISKIAAAQGLTFDQAPKIAAATAVRSASLADRRVALADKLHDDAERLREQLWAPCIVGQFGGKDNTWAQIDRPRPPFADQRQIMGAVSVAVDKSLKLAPPVDDNGAGEVGALLVGLFESLRVKHGG